MATLDGLESDGFVLLRDAIPAELVGRLRDALDAAIVKTARIQARRDVGKRSDREIENPDGGDGALGGAAHHVVLHGGPFLEFLELRPRFELIAAYLGAERFVLNSFGGVSNPPSASAYEHGMLVHRDTRSHHPSFRQLLWMFVLLDDFTEDNGGTWIMRGSQSLAECPPDDVFYDRASQVTASAGSIALLDGRVWHAAGVNHSPTLRRLLTISMSRPFIKPQLDYCRAFGAERVAGMSENLKQLLGYYARTPANLDEWYSPPEERFYRSSQG